jgi:hypothetical protein
MSVVQITNKTKYGGARPLNCGLKLKDDERCPNCNQVHMRPGYCQALDPINADQYPHLHSKRYSEALHVTDDETHPEMRICGGCGKGFEAKKVTAQYCSSACRVRAHRRGSAMAAVSDDND